MIRGGSLQAWILYFCIFHWFVCLPSAFPSCPAAAEQGVQWTETKPWRWENQPCKLCLQAKLPAPAPVFAPVSMPGTCHILQGVGFLVVAGENPSIGLGAGCTSEVQKCQGRTSQAEAKLLVWCLWFPGTIFLFHHCRSNFSRSLKMPKAVEKNCCGNGNSQVRIVYFL